MCVEIGEFPVLLLDDVMSELDNNRRAQLLLSLMAGCKPLLLLMIGNLF